MHEYGFHEKNHNDQRGVSVTPGTEQKEQYRKIALIMIVVGFVCFFIIPFIGVLLLGGGIITLLTNLDGKKT